MQPTKDKLNVGSGKSTVLNPTLRRTHWNVDIKKYEGVDEVADIREVSYPNGFFTDILCSDVLDHVTLVDARRLLRKFHGWLKPTGSLRIHTPNLRGLTRILSIQDNDEALMWLYGSDGETAYYDSNIIRWCYSKESLGRILEAIGFQIVHANEDCGGFGLSMVAIKR